MRLAIEAFLRALPDGYCIQSIQVRPQCGYADTEAGMVTALVLSDTPDDLKRFEQVIAKGIAGYTEEPGLVAQFIRTARP